MGRWSRLQTRRQARAQPERPKASTRHGAAGGVVWHFSSTVADRVAFRRQKSPSGDSRFLPSPEAMRFSAAVFVLEALRPRAAQSDPSLLPIIAVGVFGLLFTAAMIGVVFFIFSTRFKQVRDRAEPAFGPLGITGGRYITMSWRGRGAVQGRAVTVTVMAGQRNSPPSVFIELASSSRFELTVGPPIGDAGRWLRDKLSSGIEIATPLVPGVSLYTNDPSRGTTTADAAAQHIRRIMTPLSLGQQRYVFVRPGVVKLHVIGDAWQTLSPQSARADLDDLLAIAHVAER